MKIHVSWQVQPEPVYFDSTGSVWSDVLDEHTIPMVLT